MQFFWWTLPMRVKVWSTPKQWKKLKHAHNGLMKIVHRLNSTLSNYYKGFHYPIESYTKNHL